MLGCYKNSREALSITVVSLFSLCSTDAGSICSAFASSFSRFCLYLCLTFPISVSQLVFLSANRETLDNTAKSSPPALWNVLPVFLARFYEKVNFVYVDNVVFYSSILGTCDFICN